MTCDRFCARHAPIEFWHLTPSTLHVEVLYNEYSFAASFAVASLPLRWPS